MKLNSVLFIPVSSPSGIGEYMRSMIIAKALQEQWPTINIHFILNEQVSYFQDCPYTVHGCADTPTKNVKKVNAIIEQVSPDLVIFDASGRAKQFKQAKAVGAKVAFISQHNKKRNRGLKLNRLANIDIHWVAQPDYCMKPLSLWQKAKLSLFSKKLPANIGPVFESSHIEYQQKLLAQYNLIKENYFIFNAGSGGHLISGVLAADIYYQAATVFSDKTKAKCIVIFGSNYPHELPEHSAVTCLKSITNKEFVGLLANSTGCVISAGDTLLQCIALKKTCVAAPVSSDQPARLKLCQNKSLAFAAKPTANSLAEQAIKLTLPQNAERELIISNMGQQSVSQGLNTIVKDIATLFSIEENLLSSKDNVKGES